MPRFRNRSSIERAGHLTLGGLADEGQTGSIHEDLIRGHEGGADMKCALAATNRSFAWIRFARGCPVVAHDLHGSQWSPGGDVSAELHDAAEPARAECRRRHTGRNHEHIHPPTRFAGISFLSSVAATMAAAATRYPAAVMRRSSSIIRGSR
jgi:hypothetical protein